MNERIEKLLIEAHKQTYGGIYNGHLSVWTEKFAELIVQECVDICHKLAEDSDSYVVHDGDTCAEQIKNHFRVEE
jgi:uncharacterized protein YutE (UPF0331/DUF86 family)